MSYFKTILPKYFLNFSNFLNKFFLEINFLLKDLKSFFIKNIIYILLILFCVFLASIAYVWEVAPHCCDDINYIDNLSFKERYFELFWQRIIKEGRFSFAIITAILSGHIMTNMFAGASILISVIIAMFIASLWGSENKTFFIISLLLSLNPFLLMLYPWPISFGIFNVANLLLVVSFYAYCKNERLIYLLPFAIAISLGTYQPTLSFLLEVVFLHFFIRCFKTTQINVKKAIRFYGFFLLAVLAGCALYYFIVKILLTIAGVSGWITRGELWHNKVFNNLIDLISYTFHSFKWFIHNGIAAGINPSESVLVGHIGLREPLITVYQMALLTLNFILVFQSILKRSRLQICLSIAVLPVTILITILPLVVSGSDMIARVFYPFGLLLPAFILIQIEKSNRHKLSFIVLFLAWILILLLGTFQYQVFNGMANSVRFAKEEHREMLSRLFMMPNYNVKDEVLIYPYIPHKKERPDIDSRFWPLYFTYNMNQIIRFYHNYNINMVNLKDLKQGEMDIIDNFISNNKIKPWPYFNSVTYVPNIRKGVFIIYYPYILMSERTDM